MKALWRRACRVENSGFERLRPRPSVSCAIERETEMSEVTYYVALHFVASDDGAAPGEAVGCLSANATVMRAAELENLCREREVPREAQRTQLVEGDPKASRSLRSRL